MRMHVPEEGVHVRRDGLDWEVAYAGVLVKYPNRREAVEAGTRIAAAASSTLVILGDEIRPRETAPTRFA